MKKRIALFLSLTMIFALAACGSRNSGTDTEVSADKPGAKAAEGKTLVVYFSATGNTEKAANYIAEATGADTFELVPAESYSSDDLDWTDDNSRVVYEHDNPDAREVELVESTVDDWESYDTVFIGYAGGIIGLN